MSPDLIFKAKMHQIRLW